MMSPSQKAHARGAGNHTKATVKQSMLERLADNIVDERVEQGFIVTVCRTAYAGGVSPQFTHERNTIRMGLAAE